VLYDGACGLCARSVQFILDHERGPTLDFAALQSQLGQELLRQHRLAGEDSLVYLAQGQAWIRSAGALRIAAHLRPPWSWMRCGVLIPRFFSDAVYRWVAHRRTRWSPFTCRLTDATTKARFLS
jgi:predicted DCC family thiol-disulfide oxidoreductase YuxK